MDQLVEIAFESLPQLRDLYKKDWPINLVGYHTIDNYVRWLAQEPIIKNLKFYSLNGDWSDGTFLVVDRYQLFLNSLSDTNDRLLRALKLLEWRSRGYKISSFLKRHRPAVLEVVEFHNCKLEYDSWTYLYYLPKEKANSLTVNPPPGVVVKSMSEKDAAVADAVWPNRHPGSLFFLKRLIKWNPNVGAYNNEGKLMAWCFRLQAGPLGALQVDENYRRMGLGSLVTVDMVKQLAEMGQDTFALVNKDNEPSKKMLENLGFKYIDDAYWLRVFSPITGGIEWEDN